LFSSCCCIVIDYFSGFHVAKLQKTFNKTAAARFFFRKNGAAGAFFAIFITKAAPRPISFRTFAAAEAARPPLP